jgi:esterase/lipase
VPVETFIQVLMWISKHSLTDKTGKTDYVEQFKNIKVPICLIYGNQDRIAPEKLVESGYRALATKQKQLVAIKNGTHLNMTGGRQAQKIAKIAASWSNTSEL